MRAGAGKIMTEQSGGKIIAMQFTMQTPRGEVPFCLPVQSEPIFTLLQKRHSPNLREKNKIHDRLQAERIAWRLVFRWLQAQIAFIETGMVTTVEVFLPYVAMSSGVTFYKQIEAAGFKSLPLLEEKR